MTLQGGANGASLGTAVANYLTRSNDKCGSVFIVPQFEITTKKTESCPDILALDFAHREVIFVEVSVAESLGRLSEKVRHRRKHWYEPGLSELKASCVPLDGWEPRFLGFVRRDRIATIQKQFPDRDVTFVVLEDHVFDWTYRAHPSDLPGSDSQRRVEVLR
jgi:hypothetical protein